MFRHRHLLSAAILVSTLGITDCSQETTIQSSPCQNSFTDVSSPLLLSLDPLLYSYYGLEMLPSETPPEPPEPVVKFSDRDLQCLAKNIYHEARGEGRIGMLLVGHTTLNRVLSSKFPDDICRVVYQRSQFSWTIGNKEPAIRERKLYKKAKEIAKAVLHRTFDRSGGALYFYSPRVVTPTWSWDKTETITHGSHRFMK